MFRKPTGRLPGAISLRAMPRWKKAEREEMLSAALGVLQDPAMAGVFAPGGRAEAAIIGSSKQHLPEGVVINGRVDRLVVSDTEVLIVDFKTDQPAPDTPEGVGRELHAADGGLLGCAPRGLAGPRGPGRALLDRRAETHAAAGRDAFSRAKACWE
jgi:hypothetical protein